MWDTQRPGLEQSASEWNGVMGGVVGILRSAWDNSSKKQRFTANF
jgi:hypothetical protein